MYYTSLATEVIDPKEKLYAPCDKIEGQKGSE